jgi:CHASE2 domain-containing sensor protein
MRRVPPPIDIQNGQTLDSFSTAIARAVNPITTAESTKNAYYGSYIPEQTLERYEATVSAGDLLANNPDLADSLQGKIAIIGAAWHMGGFGEGEAIDQHETPVGAINGAVIHADFAEAILDSRTYARVPGGVLLALELVFAVSAAVIFALVENVWMKVGALVGMMAALCAVQWLMLIAVGTFFEAFVPILGLWLHSLVERVAG